MGDGFAAILIPKTECARGETMTELHFKSAAELSRMIQRKEIGSAELLEHFLARMEAHNPALNAIIATDLERARATAKQADEALARGEIWGPLHGLPVTVKDAFELEGVASTNGAPVHKAYVPAQDADAIARMRRAGAVIFGKTNVPYLSGDLQSYNEIYGTTNNPWNLALTPGGSSGGSAASLAAGMTGLEIGSDIGGSIRTPAHFCGVYGHKPSFGIVPKRGAISLETGLLAEADLSVIGPMGRSTEDLSLLLELIADPIDPAASCWHLDLPPARAKAPGELRLAVWVEDPFCEIDIESAKLIHAAADRLEAEGARVDREARPEMSLAEITEIYLMLLHANIAARMPEAIKTRFRDTAASLPAEDKSHQALQARGATLSYADWLYWNERRAQMRAMWERFFTRYDAVLAPVLMRPAFPHDHASNWHKRSLAVNGKDRPYLDALIWAGPAVAAYLPATSVPVGLTSETLPVNAQVIGPFGGDRTTLAVAEMIEATSGGFRAPPGY